jgi:hypothetical protein
MRNLSDRDAQLATSQDSSAEEASAVVSLDSRRVQPAWERDIDATLCRYVELPSNWDSYGGKPLREDTKRFALQILSSVMNERTPVPSLVPVSTGGVQCEWHQNGLDIELYIEAPYECELTVYDHVTGAPPSIFPLVADLSPLFELVKILTDFTRHRNVA